MRLRLPWNKEGGRMEPTVQTLHNFLNTMPAVLYEYAQNRNGYNKVLYISPTSKEILGHPGSYFMENINNFWKIIHPDDREQLIAEDEATIDDSCFAAEARIVWPTGEVRWIRFTSKPVSRTEDGTVTWCGCIIDITSLKQAQEEVRRLRGIIPICMHCKGIRNDSGYWTKLEEYIEANADVEFSHSICDNCLKERYPEEET
jgi:PAS domain S-box-containing protein